MDQHPNQPALSALARRRLMVSVAMLSLGFAASPTRSSTRRPDIAQKLRELEVGHARLGVCFLDTATGEIVGNRLDERFAMCSTFKLPLVVAYLRESDAGRIDLNERLTYTRRDLLPWAPSPANMSTEAA